MLGPTLKQAHIPRANSVEIGRSSMAQPIIAKAQPDEARPHLLAVMSASTYGKVLMMCFIVMAETVIRWHAPLYSSASGWKRWRRQEART
jgi:hypothetical protein